MSDTVTPFPPPGPTTLQGIIPAYIYQEYSDDINVTSFFVGYNQLAQQYLNTLNGLNLPIYTGLAGSLLDLVAQGVYGISRPSLPFGVITSTGPLDTQEFATFQFAQATNQGQIQQFTTTDDIFKRIITWFFFKGDGQQFTIPWFKRRVMRFLVGVNGTSPNIDNTYPVSVAFGSPGTITITLASNYPVTLINAQVFQAAYTSGAISNPFQFSFVVVINNTLGNTGLTDVSGVLHVTNTLGWPIAATGLPPGAVWDNAGVVNIVSGVTPNPAAPAMYFGTITAPQLLAAGGGNLPTSDPLVALQIWNNAGVANVSAG